MSRSVAPGGSTAFLSRHAGPVVLLVIALAGAPAIGGALVSDDHFVVPRAAPDLARIWTGGLFGGFAGAAGAQRAALLDMYRPLALTTFALEHAVHGLRPWVYHLANLLLHVGACALLYALLQRTNGRRAAVIGTLVFGLHPAAGEAWIWVSGRFDLLLALFLVGALLALERGWSVAAGLLALAACLSKETGVLALAALAARPRWPVEQEGPPWRLRPARALVALGLAGAVAVALRIVALGDVRADAGAPVLAYLQRWAGPWLVDAAATTLLPIGPSFVEPAEAYNRLPTAALVGSIALVVAAAGAAWWQRRRKPALVWGAAGAGLLLLPPVLALTIGKGRYLYAPLALALPGLLGLAATAGAALARRMDERRARLLGVLAPGAYLVALAAGLLDAAAAFRDEPTLWRTVMERRPGLSAGWGLYGNVLVARGRLDEGRALLEKAHALAPVDLRWIGGLAVASLRAGDPARCEALNRKGAALAPRDPQFAFGRALCLRALGDGAGARVELARGLALAPAHEGLLRLRAELDGAR